MSDDSQQIEAALAGDAAAFGVLVTKYQDRLYNSLLRMLGSAEDASDVVQEAFTQAFLKLDTFRGSAAFYTWLYRIAFHRATDLRRRQRPVSSIDDAKERVGDEPLDNREAPLDALGEQERAQQVHRALGMLSDEHRRVLVLREIDDCSYDAISKILEVPVGTVRSRLFRARLEMKQRLEQVLGRDFDQSR